MQSISLYVYRMYVRRVPKRSQETSHTRFAFSAHYQLSHRYMQEVSLTRVSVPTIDGFQCPTAGNDPEQNSLLKALLFTPWICTDARIRGGMEVASNRMSCSADPFPPHAPPDRPAPAGRAGQDVWATVWAAGRKGGHEWVCGRAGARAGTRSGLEDVRQRLQLRTYALERRRAQPLPRRCCSACRTIRCATCCADEALHPKAGLEVAVQRDTRPG